MIRLSGRLMRDWIFEGVCGCGGSTMFLSSYDSEHEVVG